jgi:hypothetical protein
MFNCMKFNFAASAALSTALVLSASSSNAAGFTVDLKNQAGTATTRSFSSGPLTINFNYTPSGTPMPSPVNTQNYVTSSLATGYCVFANQSDTLNRCNTTGSGQTLNFTRMSTNLRAYLTGGNISQIFGSPGPISIYSSLNGPSLATISSAVGDFSLASPIFLAANQSIYFGSSGTDASIRLANLRFEEPVPAPTAILGAGAAFGWSRRLRKRISSKV